jgi:phosphatidylinositol glycan class B
VLFRVANTLLVQSYFNPDEYWQGPEVAHRMAFGYGHLTWEWSGAARLRSCVHPLVFAGLYRALRALGCDTRWAVAWGPRLLQAGAAGLGDLYVYRLGVRVFGERAGRWALACSLTSWFNFYCITRTFSNSLEAVLTVVALSLWPMDYGAAVAPLLPSKAGASATTTAVTTTDITTSLPKALAVAALAVLVRPTSVLVWIPVGVVTVFSANSLREAARVVGLACCIGSFALALCIVADTTFYGPPDDPSQGKWTFVLRNFVSFNLINGLDKLYGAHPWHWYLSQGLPAVFGGLLPTVALGGYWVCKRRPKVARVFVSIMVFVTLALSMTAHKEFRFVLPLLPLACVLSGHALDLVDVATKPSSGKSPHSNSPTTTTKTTRASWQAWRGTFVAVLACVCVLNIAVAAFVSLVHQRGAVDVVNFLAGEATATTTRVTGRMLTSVHFLTPCHATPYHSMLHVIQGAVDPVERNANEGRSWPRHGPLGMRFLDCSPEIMVVDYCGGRACDEAARKLLPRHAEPARGEVGPRDGETTLSQSAAFERDPGVMIRHLYRQRSVAQVEGGGRVMDNQSQRFANGGKVVAEWHWGGQVPSHVVLFTSEETESVKAFLAEEKRCSRIADFFHELIQGDIHASRIRGRIAVWYCPTPQHLRR